MNDAEKDAGQTDHSECPEWMCVHDPYALSGCPAFTEPAAPEADETGEGKADRYPPTIWHEYREDVMPHFLMAAVMVVLMGLIFDARDVTMAGLITAGLTMVSIVPVLFFEYRAGMKYDREHPQDDKEAQA